MGNLRMIERGYFSWRDRNDAVNGSVITSTLVNQGDHALITLTSGATSYELSVRPDGVVAVVRNGVPAGGFVLESVSDIEAILYSVSFPLLDAPTKQPL